MKLVRQKHEYGCVIACIAMITGISYDEALKVCLPNRKSGQKIIGVMVNNCFFKRISKLGFKFREVKPALSYKKDALVSILHPIYGGNCRHMIIWSKKLKRYLDPFPNRNRKMKKQLPQKSYRENTIGAFVLIDK